MPSIASLNASNASFVLQSGNYTDLNIFFAIVGITIVLLIASRFVKDDIGRLLIAAMSFISSVAVIWTSLSVAIIDKNVGATIDGYNYVYSTFQPVAAPWLTGLCIIFCVFAFLNALDIFIVMMQRPQVDEQKKNGRGIRI